MTKRTRPYAIERYPLINDWLVMPAFGPDENVTTSAAICTSRRTQLDRNHVLRQYLPGLDRHVDVGSVEENEVLQLGVDYRLPTGEIEEFRRDYRVTSKSGSFIELEVHPSVLSAIRASRKALLMIWHQPGSGDKACVSNGYLLTILIGIVCFMPWRRPRKS